MVLVALVLLVAQLLPSPRRRHPSPSRFGPDKLLHGLGHAGFVAVLADALAGEGFDDRVAALGAVAISTGYGVATGELQRLVPGRALEPADLVAGLVGSVLGAVGWCRLAGDVPHGPVASGSLVRLLARGAVSCLRRRTDLRWR